MALGASIFGCHSMRSITGHMRVMAGDACHLALLKALAFAKMNNLIGNTIGFVILGMNGSVMILKFLTGPEAQSWAFVIHGIAVALGADIN